MTADERCPECGESAHTCAHGAEHGHEPEDPLHIRPYVRLAEAARGDRGEPEPEGAVSSRDGASGGAHFPGASGAPVSVAAGPAGASSEGAHVPLPDLSPFARHGTDETAELPTVSRVSGPKRRIFFARPRRSGQAGDAVEAGETGRSRDTGRTANAAGPFGEAGPFADAGPSAGPLGEAGPAGKTGASSAAGPSAGTTASESPDSVSGPGPLLPQAVVSHRRERERRRPSTGVLAATGVAAVLGAGADHAGHHGRQGQRRGQRRTRFAEHADQRPHRRCAAPLTRPVPRQERGADRTALRRALPSERLGHTARRPGR
ncbi:hypothetical protein GCM10009863_05790 [Streptomyces axinellae]|uniref:Uncharacterized protein n=1 Tax=Streptomyces axinellae TaxID=552788 RepID=A0ABN3PNX4_9ACTN